MNISSEQLVAIIGQQQVQILALQSQLHSAMVQLADLRAAQHDEKGEQGEGEVNNAE